MIYLLKMKRVDRNFNLFLACFAFAATAVAGQNAAPSSHFVFDDNFDGHILINEVRVPKLWQYLCVASVLLRIRADID